MDLGRDELSTDDGLRGRQLCRAYTERADAFLRHLLAEATDDHEHIAVVALGGYGRQELSLQSDLDVLLLHDGRSDIDAVADAVWYPIWDTGVKLGHAVRTPKEALSLASEDLDSATALLQARHVAGDAALTAEVAERMAEQWRRRAKRVLPEMATRVRERHERAGEVAFLLEPDLKEGRGGLRDVQALDWSGRARPLLWEGDDEALVDAYNVLLDVRVELHRRTGRPGDILLLQEQDAVAAALGLSDADELVRRVSTAARTIAFRSDDAWRRIDSALRGPIGRLARRDRALSDDLVLRDGEVHLHDRVGNHDPVLPLRAAVAAARHDAPLHRSVLDRLEGSPALTDPWPVDARTSLVDLLGAGRPAIGLLESLDQHGLLETMLPEWRAVRCRPQRNAYHTFTVDRHLCETASNAATLASRVDRPDLLLIGAWLHDIGKGYPGDHTVEGMRLIREIGTRMGFAPADVDTLVMLVENHLLLPDVATRRDLEDPEVIELVALAVGTESRLGLLHALCEADSMATGPAAWGPWKAELVSLLVRRVAHVLGGGAAALVTDDFPTDEQRARLATGARVVEGVGQELVVIDRDRPGLLSKVTGVLALHGLDVLDANVASIDGRALEVLTVQSSFGPTVSWGKVLHDLDLALDGRLALKARLAERRAVYERSSPVPLPDPKIDFHAEESSHATVVEVWAPDQIGVLHRITAALADFELDIMRARVQTLGDEVIDSFYVQTGAGQKVPEALWPELRRAVLHAIDHL